LNNDILQTLWTEHRRWSAAAGQLKSRRGRWRSIALTLTVIGAVLHTIAATLTTSSTASALSIIGTIALAIVPIISGRILTPEATRKWLRARSVSEGIKSEIYTFCAGGEPYTDPNTSDLLRQRVQAITKWGSGLELDLARVGSVAASAPPPRLDADRYLAQRVRKQIEEYYRPRAHKYARLAALFQKAQTILTGLAAALGAVTTVSEISGPSQLGPWVAVLTTVGASLAAHTAAARYEFQATTFFATARQLEDLVNQWRATATPTNSKEWSDFVRDCESAISAENRGWMAKLDEDVEA